MSRLTPERVRATLDHPYVACCGGCGTRLFCALADGDSPHGTNTRVQRDVHDLAADLLDAHAALDAHRTRADAAEAECARLRAAMQRQAAAVRMLQSAREQMDAHDQATLASLAGQDRKTLIEETAAARRERDDWNARATELEMERDTAHAEADALRAQVAEARAERTALRERMQEQRAATRFVLTLLEFYDPDDEEQEAELNTACRELDALLAGSATGKPADEGMVAAGRALVDARAALEDALAGCP